MIYPTISEYIEAIKSAEANFEELKNLRPVLGADGEPVMTSGNFAVVFKMKDEQTGKLYALKCFLKEQEGRTEAYRMIAEELRSVSSPYLMPIRYLDRELFVDSTISQNDEFPVLLMDWVEGRTLDKYIREHIDDEYELSLLAYQFSSLAVWLMPQPFAHGDLKPDNILVKDDGTLVLVDYDGMYVPAMTGQKARELGSPDFRHPARIEDDFDERIDDFSLASILLSLKTIFLQPSLLEEYGASDRLLFSEKDYCNLSESKVMDALKPLLHDTELASLYSLFILALSQNNLYQVSSRLFSLKRPDKSQDEEENLSTEVTEEDIANAWADEYGVKYSRDQKKILKGNPSLLSYSIAYGTLVICDGAFSMCEVLISVELPNTITHIGSNAFGNCSKLKQFIIPPSVEFIKGNPFMKINTNLKIECLSPYFFVDILFDESNGIRFYSLYSADRKILYYCGYHDTLYHYVYNKYSTDPDEELIEPFHIPLTVETIAQGAFCSNESNLSQPIIIPESVKRIEKCAFCCCTFDIVLRNTIEYIDKEAFQIVGFPDSRHVSHIFVPNGSGQRFKQQLPYDENYIIEQDL